MSKYALLEAHLRKFGGRDVPMTFAEIEEVIGNRLPSSAFKHRPWWSNNRPTASSLHAWLRAGYVSAEVDMAGFRLVFRKSERRQFAYRCGGIRFLTHLRCVGRHGDDKTGDRSDRACGRGMGTRRGSRTDLCCWLDTCAVIWIAHGDPIPQTRLGCLDGTK